MSRANYHHVLALLHDDEPEACEVLDRAVELAEAHRARLTLAKTSDPGRLVRWCAPLAALGRCAPLVEPDPGSIASRTLARISQRVPASVPLSMVVLGTDTACSTRKLLARAHYDVMVLSARHLARDFRLRRLLERLEVGIVAVTRDPLERGTAAVTRPQPIADATNIGARMAGGR